MSSGVHRYWLLDAASYYFDNALRLGQPDYCATDEDVIMTRIRTTGIDTTEFSEPPFMYSVVDVGGQRNERRKWIHCFDNVRVRFWLMEVVSASACWWWWCWWRSCCCCCGGVAGAVLVAIGGGGGFGGVFAVVAVVHVNTSVSMCCRAKDAFAWWSVHRPVS